MHIVRDMHIKWSAQNGNGLVPSLMSQILLLPSIASSVPHSRTFSHCLHLSLVEAVVAIEAEVLDSSEQAGPPHAIHALSEHQKRGSLGRQVDLSQQNNHCSPIVHTCAHAWRCTECICACSGGGWRNLGRFMRWCDRFSVIFSYLSNACFKNTRINE